jgi:hypothetical protein
MAHGVQALAVTAPLIKFSKGVVFSPFRVYPIRKKAPSVREEVEKRHEIVLEGF